MQSKAPARNGSFRLEDREQQLARFVTETLEQMADGRPDSILLVARSPESIALRVIATLSSTLALRGVGARVVLAAPGQSTPASGDAQGLFSSGFHQETRLFADPRILGAHEQMIVGETGMWFGDSMRREPDKLDAFASFSRDIAGILAARATFVRLWSATSATAQAYTADRPTAAHLPAAPQAGAGEILTASVLESLRAWHPFTRH